MNFSVSKISLRGRLLLMTAFALLALFIAVLSAYRTARMSDYYAERQASLSVRAVLRDLLRGGINEGEKYNAGGKMPPHVREAFEKYSDEKKRATAIALGPERDVSAGFCDVVGEPQGVIYNQNFSQDEMPVVQGICKNLDSNNAQRYEYKNSVLFVEAVKIDDAKDGVSGVFTARSISRSGITADRFNFLTQVFLLLAAIGLAVFSFLTLREWNGGMRNIESGLQKIPNDLSERIEEPKVTELALLSREINRLAANLETNLGRQKELEKNLVQAEKLAALGRVASGAAHEIRNPLAAMKLKIQMAERGDFDKSRLEKTFAVLNEEITRLDRLISKMLDTGKQEKLNYKLISPTDILRSRLDFLHEKAHAQSIQIETDLSEDKSINADVEKLTQIFDNLLLNAFEAMPDGGVLKVRSLIGADKIIYEISDSGAGVSAKDKEKLFEPFFTTKDKGHGLGLAISREIIKAHGGELFLADSEKGAKFVVELPFEKR